MKTVNGWILLLYALPTKQSSDRVNLWRKLKKFGAIQLKTSAYLLPDSPTHHERFQWLAKQILDDGGDATLIRVKDIEGLSQDHIIALFNQARSKDYHELMRELRELIKRNQTKKSIKFLDDLEKLRQLYHEISERDYFECPQGQDCRMLLQKAELLSEPKKSPNRVLNRKDFTGKTWLTRPRPEGDRVSSAWLILKFIDPEAKFVFANRPSDHPKAIPFDMFEVEFSHHGDDCTFETLIKRFKVEDKAAQKVGEMVHDADLEDDKFKQPEMIGIDQVLKGLAKQGLSDEDILTTGFKCLDALYTHLKSD